ncbi:MAG: GntR family transcriptional regulator [Clostridiales bacterium]|nr:GntR family transcriptional regulator [Clostridiales bacterium]
MKWNFTEGIPIYTQIVDEITMRIAGGSYSPGDKLPSVRELAIDAGVNPNTMQKALAELERRELVHSERTSGRYVTEDENILRTLKAELSNKYFVEFEEKLRGIGMTDSEITEAVKKWLSDLNA